MLPSNVRTLRRLLGDTRSEQRFIQTSYGRGYRFVAPIVREAEPALPEQALARQDQMVGRAAIMEQLRSSLAMASAGSGQLVPIGGEPGIGKTRILEEFARVTRERGVDVLLGRCLEGGGAPVYWPWIQLLGGALRDRDASSLRSLLGSGGAHIVKLIPELAAVLGDLPAPASDSPFLLVEAVAQTLKALASERPLVLLLDDLHLADRASLLLLRATASELLSHPVLIVGTRRTHEPFLSPDLDDLSRDARCQSVALGGLTAADIGDYVEALTSQRPSEALRSSLHERTRGNPFFVREIVQLMLREGDSDFPAAVAGWRGPLPEGVRDAIQYRVGRLAEESQRALVVAAFLGREFAVAPLAIVLDSAREPLLDSLDHALHAGLIRETHRSAGRFAFVHAVTMETLYDSVPSRERATIHRRVAEMLEKIHAGDLESHLAEVAHHHLSGAAVGEDGKAVRFGLRAAEAATQVFAWDDAALLYQRVLDALDLGGSEGARERCEVLLALGDAHSRRGGRGGRDEARACFARAGAMAREIGAEHLLARAALGMGGRVEELKGRDDQVRALLEDALAAVGDADASLRAALLARLAGSFPNHADPDRRAAMCSEALRLAREDGSIWGAGPCPRRRDPGVLVRPRSARMARLHGCTRERPESDRASRRPIAL